MSERLGWKITPRGSTLSSLIAVDGIDDELLQALRKNGTVVVPLVSADDMSDRYADYERLSQNLIQKREETEAKLHSLRVATKALVDSLPTCASCAKGKTCKKTCPYSRALVAVMKELGS